MKKYWQVFSTFWQEAMTRRSTFIVERFRALVVLTSFYYFWDAILKHKPSFAGYNRDELMTYVLGMNILRSLVFATRTEEITAEINQGRLSIYLLKPMNFLYYTFFKDLSEKTINLLSAILEICVLVWVFDVNVQWPQSFMTWGLCIASMLSAVWLYFIISFTTGCGGFWTSETWGPRFLLELFLEFTAGAFFPLTVLPPLAQQIFMLFPSPYLIFFPIQLFLEKMTLMQIMNGFCIQITWIFVITWMSKIIWGRGMRIYSAAGS
jgi:ABC-2 type transport system permease protein